MVVGKGHPIPGRDSAEQVDHLPRHDAFRVRAARAPISIGSALEFVGKNSEVDMLDIRPELLEARSTTDCTRTRTRTGTMPVRSSRIARLRFGWAPGFPRSARSSEPR